MANNNKTTNSAGLGFFSILTLIFITLKLTGVIAWSWWWVLIFMWLPIVVVILGIILISIFAVAFD
jgi:hypothetical protein